MKIAKLFMNGKSQAVRLPKEFRFKGDDVYIRKLGNIVMIYPKEDHWTFFEDSLNQFSNDFMSERNQPENQNRKDVFE
ncbi:MAG: antitoxin [Candidatus Marinimicrobia bacterium]|nr:antitoxin [Candidatus Neomarinimicrobiota bacterium]